MSAQVVIAFLLGAMAFPAVVVGLVAVGVWLDRRRGKFHD
jgi:hypothetical protein